MVKRGTVGEIIHRLSQFAGCPAFNKTAGSPLLTGSSLVVTVSI